jgi:VIT1/CCC1 family predicted Fe2+/Mn2+ transporter
MSRRFESARHFSYGGTAAIVTSMSLIVGFDVATVARTTLLTGLLIVALADNLTDSLAIHMYQESEQLDGRTAFDATVSNFATRLGLSLSFVALAAFLPRSATVIASIVWGLSLLSALTYVIARRSGRPPAPEIVKHLLTAVAVMLMSKAISHFIVERAQ